MIVTRAPWAGYVGIATVCLVAAVACGSASGGTNGVPRGIARQAPKVDLTITVTGVPGTTTQRWTLTCDPVGGTHPHPATACADLLQLKSPFAPQPKGMACPMILASSGEATIEGTYLGEPVNSTIRDGGCTLGLWRALG